MSDDLVKRGRDHAELLRKMDEVCEPRQVSTPSQKLLLAMADEIERLRSAITDGHVLNEDALVILSRRTEAAEAREAKLREALPDDLRSYGWAVAVHNDYRQDSEDFTFWLLTMEDHCIKGEGRTDAEALNQIRQALQDKSNG